MEVEKLDSEEKEINIISLIIDIYEIVQAKRILIVSVFATVFSLSMGYFLLKAPVFKTEFIISSSVVSSERIAIIVDPIGKLVEENNIAELSKLLHIDSVTASRIVTIEAKEIKDETKAGTNTSNDSEGLRSQNCLVTLKVKRKPELYDTIEAGILYYVRNNDFVSRKSNSDMNNLKSMKERIRKEIKALDSLKIQIAQKGNSGYMFMDPSSINNSIASLYQNELNIDLKMKMDDQGINIIRGFPRFKKPVEPKLKLILIIAFVLSTILSSLIIMFQNTYRKRQLAK